MGHELCGDAARAAHDELFRRLKALAEASTDPAEVRDVDCGGVYGTAALYVLGTGYDVEFKVHHDVGPGLNSQWVEVTSDLPLALVAYFDGSGEDPVEWLACEIAGAVL